jgi:hypothetical protein
MCPINNNIDELQEVIIINNDNTIENLSKPIYINKSNSSYKINEKKHIVTKQPKKQLNTNTLNTNTLNTNTLNTNTLNTNTLNTNTLNNNTKETETSCNNEISYTEEPRLRKLVKKKNKKMGISSSDEEEWDII